MKRNVILTFSFLSDESTTAPRYSPACRTESIGSGLIFTTRMHSLLCGRFLMKICAPFYDKFAERV